MNTAQPQQLDLPNTLRASSKPVRTKREWTTRELAILSQHYPQGGVPACLEKLPQRTGEATVWTIARAPFRRWVAENAHLVDIRRVDKCWFFDLAFGSSK